ncbi:helix-turn-helix domain-containing protein [Streptococcus sp. SQ9-PEA]|uniref:Helix-turn-helix domain-containing protein n=2 Tax=Streptococcus sciuri TaxID=2973939 RepID=A0ABT2F8A4_9STRE|nr:helix-turn-helix domain-containing protein [Streptococcus sciuri]
MKKITRKTLCGDEKYLTVRQLSRIEKGIASPKLSTIEYIARQLGVTLAVLLGEVQLEKSQAYIELKNKLLAVEDFRVHHPLFESLYNDYYDELTDEEKWFIDVLFFERLSFKKGNLPINKDLNKHFEIIDFSQELTLADYSVLNVHVLNLVGDKALKKLSKNILNYVKNRVVHATKQELICMQRVLFMLLVSLSRSHYYHLLDSVTQTSKDVMRALQNFTKMPLIILYEAKYELFIKKDVIEAVADYNKALELASLFELNDYRDHIQTEMTADLNSLIKEDL